MRFSLSFCLLFVLLVIAGCRKPAATGTVVTSSQEPQEDVEAPYVEGNKRIIHLETEEIEQFIQRYGWKMDKTGTGLGLYIARTNVENMGGSIDVASEVGKYTRFRFDLPLAE